MNGVSYGKAVDIWATGMIMYEVLTKGCHPILENDINNIEKLSFEEYKAKLNSLKSKTII